MGHETMASTANQRISGRNIKADDAMDRHAMRRRRFDKIPAAQRGGYQWGPPLSTAALLDGDLLAQFQQLPRSQQTIVARAADMSREVVSRHIRTLAQAFAVF